MAAIYMATASTSGRGWRDWRRPAASAYRAPFATISATGSPTLSRTWGAERQEHRAARAGLCMAPRRYGRPADGKRIVHRVEFAACCCAAPVDRGLALY